MMGGAAFIIGFFYNDLMSIPLQLSNSCYYESPWADPTSNHPTTNIRPDCVYPIGLDYTWYKSHNVLVFFNSMKMKIAVIFGVAQMSLGLLIKAANSLYFDRMVEFLFEFIPMLTLLTVLFGYMSMLIIIKWVTPWPDPSVAPSIIGFMINMFLKMGEVIGEPLIGSKATNEEINVILLVIAVACVPLMLLVKPLWFKFTHEDHSPKKKKKDGFYEFEDEEEGGNGNGLNTPPHENGMSFEREEGGQTDMRMRGQEA